MPTAETACDQGHFKRTHGAKQVCRLVIREDWPSTAAQALLEPLARLETIQITE
jgi:hypothetical protein